MNYETIKIVCENCDPEDTVTIKIKDLKSIINNLKLTEIETKKNYSPFFELNAIDFLTEYRSIHKNDEHYIRGVIFAGRLKTKILDNFGPNVKFKDLLHENGDIKRSVSTIRGLGSETLWFLHYLYEDYEKDRKIEIGITLHKFPE
jgi:hypothetical protein